MGDLRNKARKDEETARTLAMQAKIEGQQPAAQAPRCSCGLTYHQVEVMWAIQADRWAPVQFYCPACLPPA